MLQVICDNVSQCIHKGSGRIIAIIVDADGANGNIIIYDGESTKGKKIIVCRALSNCSFSPYIPFGLGYDHGLYVGVNASTTTYTIILSNNRESVVKH